MQITTLKYLFIAAAGLVLFLDSCKRPDTLFQLIPASQSGVDFNNLVTENDSINPLDMEYLYNGGGVAIGDFNNDGNPDLYFTASQTSNRMYLNQGNPNPDSGITYQITFPFESLSDGQNAYCFFEQDWSLLHTHPDHHHDRSRKRLIGPKSRYPRDCTVLPSL